VAFESQPHIGYVCGDAQAAYGDRLTRFRRHVALIRPSLICVVDDLESPKPAEFQWLLHASEKFRLDQKNHTLTSHRSDTEMEVHLITPGGFESSQTNEWPVAPKAGYPTAKKPEPTKLWHFTATTRERANTRRIAAIMNVGTSANRPDYTVQVNESGTIRVQTTMVESKTVVEVNLKTKQTSNAPLLAVRCKPKVSEAETLSVTD
jgi:hypothetical protein